MYVYYGRVQVSDPTLEGGGARGRGGEREGMKEGCFCVLFSLVDAVIGGPSRPSSEGAPFT